MTDFRADQTGPTPGRDGQFADAGATQDPQDASVITRHEERLDVQKTKVASGRIRIGKKVIVETVQVPVQVRREVLVYEELPADGSAGAAPSTGQAADASYTLADTEHPEVVLHAERPRVSLETVQVERVRLVTSRADGEETVTKPVRRERVELVHADPAAS